MKPISNQRIAVIGYGVTGKACINFLLGKCAALDLFDVRSPEDLDRRVKFYEFTSEIDLNNYYMVVMSPGVSPHQPCFEKFTEQGGRLISEIQLFSYYNTVPTIGVTGSNGKTTVTELLGHCFSDIGNNVKIGGNVGTPAISLLDQNADLIILELSSFQLELTSRLELDIAVLLNISEDHLDRHGTMQAYLTAKQRIFAYAHCCICIDDIPESFPPEHYKVLKRLLVKKNTEFSGDSRLLLCDKDRSIYLDGKQFLSYEELKIIGNHNRLNALVVAAICLYKGMEPIHLKQRLTSFKGLPHRTEVVHKNQFVWINDSKATNVGATIAAFENFSEQDCVIALMGGDAKGASVERIEPYLGRPIRAIIGIGKDAKLFEALCKIRGTCAYAYAVSMEEAALMAYELCLTINAEDESQTAYILLSPACASIDMFKNYQERGEKFTTAAQQIDNREAS